MLLGIEIRFLLLVYEIEIRCNPGQAKNFNICVIVTRITFVLYTVDAGCFRFRLWRFGEWTDVSVDDFLPTLNGTLAYFPAIQPNNELWGALLEKAYAK